MAEQAPDPAQSDPTLPTADQPEMGQADVGQPEAAQPEQAQPQAGQPDIDTMTQASLDELEAALKAADVSDAAAPGAEPSGGESTDAGKLDPLATSTDPATDESGHGDEPSLGDDPGGSVPLDQVSIDELLKAASFEDPSSLAGGDLPPDAQDVALPNFAQVIRDAQVSSIDLLKDVDLNVKIELGRSRMLVVDVLTLGDVSVVELDKLAGDPVDVIVNVLVVARGEVLVLTDYVCDRVYEVLSGVRV